jgi:hypothetical protein
MNRTRSLTPSSATVRLTTNQETESASSKSRFWSLDARVGRSNAFFVAPRELAEITIIIRLTTIRSSHGSELLAGWSG